MTDAPAAGGQGAPSVAPVAPINTGAITEPNNGTPGQLSNGFEWLKGADDQMVGYAQNKGWDNPLKAVDSYRNLEKLFGADKAGRTVVMPKEGEDFGAFYDRLGRPSAPDGYGFEAANGDANFAKSLGEKFHEFGLTKAQGAQLGNWFNEMISTGQKGEQEQFAQRSAAEAQELQNEWGAAYTQQIAAAERGALELGFDKPSIDRIEQAIGFKATMQLFQKFGALLPEPNFETGTGSTNYGNLMTPPQAQSRIQELNSDPAWREAYLKGGMNSKEFKEMQRLQSMAYPEKAR